MPLAFRLWLLPACLPASGGRWASLLPASSPLVFAQSFVLWTGLAVPWVRAFCVKVLSLYFLFFYCLSLAVPWFGLLSQVSAFRLPSGHSGPVLTLSSAACTFLFSPCLLVADASVWATSPLGVAVKCVICGFYLFIFSSQLCCPLRFPKLPTDPPVRGFPGVWKLLLF